MHRDVKVELSAFFPLRKSLNKKSQQVQEVREQRTVDIGAPMGAKDLGKGSLSIDLSAE